MSSSYVVEPQESESKKDDTLIIVVNDDGTISVDQETLQNLIMNQSNANVSVVRLGQTEGDAENGDITLTVDPPSYVPPEPVTTALSTATTDAGVAGLVDPFMEMDSEQLERLETALQSEEAKQILGENVTAMLDMLSVEEEQNCLKHSIQLDHCYTSRKSPSDPKPSDPLPIAESPDIDAYGSGTSSTASGVTSYPAKGKAAKAGRGHGRPRVRQQVPGGVTIGTPMGAGNVVPRNALNILQQGANKGALVPLIKPLNMNDIRMMSGVNDEAVDDEAVSSTSSESSESEPPSDDDSDFGPRGPRRGGVRARGGRKGLTTRGGSMAATRRRATSNKQMDMDLVRRLDLEMAAAVDAMKSPDKEDKSDKFSPVNKAKKQLKTMGGKKKEEPAPASTPPIPETPAVYEKPLQTTNQVKANLINANMIKGDMILTKPGQMKNNQKVIFVQKQVMMRASELKNLGMKKQQQIVVSKSNLTNQMSTKVTTIKDGKLLTLPVTSRVVAQPTQATPQPKVVAPQVTAASQQLLTQLQLVSQQNVPQQQQVPKVVQQHSISVVPPKSKTPEIKKEKKRIDIVPELLLKEKKKIDIVPEPLLKEKKKIDIVSEPLPKIEPEPVKPVEPKTPDGKKHMKREHRKSPAHLAGALGPALFSTPDIIRRVGSGCEPKTPDTPTTPSTPTPSTSIAPSNTVATPVSTPVITSVPTSVTSAPNASSSPVTQAATTSRATPIAEASAVTPIVEVTSAIPITTAVLTTTMSATSPVISIAPTIAVTAVATTALVAPSVIDTSVTPIVIAAEPVESVVDTKMESVSALDEVLQPELHSQLPVEDRLEMQEDDGAQKMDLKVPLAEELQPSLNTASNSVPPVEVSTPIERTLAPDHNVSETSGIEGEEHLLATLEMEASKHEEDLLAEALLLQEELGVDLADHAGLVDQSQTVSEPLLQAATFDSAVVTPVEEPPEQSITPVLTASSSVVMEQGKKGLSEEKEPIQIVRGGRVITLPPIEAPATRSKRLQAKNELPAKKADTLKKNDKLVLKQGAQQPQLQLQMQLQQQQQQLFKNEEMDSDMDEDDDEDGNSDSEDDPDRLWCICKRPHNNRFMICCDVCEDWFHGKCVHVSKAMGQQMEEKGIEWVCPNCTKKKVEEAKIKLGTQPASVKVQKTLEHFLKPVAKPQLSPIQAVPTPIPVQPAPPSATVAPIQIPAPLTGVTQCVVCKKEARNSSIYCSDACILTHAQESLTKDKPPAAPPPLSPTPLQTQSKAIKMAIQDTPRMKPDARVIVFERKTGKVLTGADAPTTSNLKTWLKENPTFEVVRPNNLNTLQIGGKTVTAIQTQGAGKITRAGQQILGKAQAQAKMVYTKVVGSKQTVLASSNKKVLVSPGGQQQQSNASPSMKAVQSRQTLLTPTLKNPTVVTKQVTPKASPQQQSKLQTMIPSKQAQIKKQEVKPSTSQQKVPTKSPLAKRPDTEPIRLNIKKTLAELLSSRIKETDDLKLTEDEITNLALSIELEMYKFFKDTGAKYKAKYRSLVFNIKDTKNLTLFRKIADRSLAPDAVVRLSPDEMASQELAEWREKEAKHQLEMIKKNELDLMAQAKSIVVKTHKGEQIIENEDSIDHVDPQTPVQDIVTALNSGDGITSTVEDDKDKEKEDGGKFKMREDPKKSSVKSVSDDRKKKEKDKELGRERDKHDDRSRSRSRRHRSRDQERSRERRSTRSKDTKREKDRDRERERERDREKDREKEKEREKERDRQKDKDKYKRSSRSSTRNQSRSRHRDYKEKDKKEEERKKDVEKKEEPTPPPADKPIEDRLWRHIEEETTTNTLDGNESDVSDREPSSTVNIKTPDINEDLEKEKEHATEKEPAKGTLQTVWRGFVNMVDVAKFFITAQEVSGHARDLMDDLPDTVDVVGRISHETVWDYISKMKKTGSKEILVIRLTAANDEEKIPYITLYSYLNSRSRLGVVGNVSKNIKDFYIMPLSSQSLIPQVLLPLDGPGFEEHRPHLLLGIIVRNKRKRSSIAPVVVPAKVAKKEPERSYTPPIVDIPKEKLGTATPPLSPKPHSKPPPLESVKGKQQTITQTILENLNKAHVGMSRTAIENVKISKIVPELSSKIGLISPQKSSHKEAPVDDDDDDDDGDEPYSPGGIDDEPPNSLPKRLLDTAVNTLSPNKNSTELQRKMDELNRQIEEQKQQIQSISSSFLGETTTTLPGLGLDPPSNDMDEAYSPSDSRSFTPPPPGITKLAQPLLDKVSNITIPANLQEILANVKRQESSKVDPYLPSKPSATFLTSVNSSAYQKTEKYSPLYPKITGTNTLGSEKTFFETQQPTVKENKSTLRSLSDLDLIKKAEEELAAVAAASPITSLSRGPSLIPTMVPPPVPLSPVQASPLVPTMVPPPAGFSAITEPADTKVPHQLKPIDNLKLSFLHDQPKPPGLEDEEFPIFPLTTPPPLDGTSKSTPSSKFVPKSGIVVSVKRKVGDESSSCPSKAPRTKSRWGQGPSSE